MSRNNMKRQIQPVENREDKRKTYQEQMKRYNKAMSNGFYFEAIVIDYACLEDRLRYMLYYLGVLNGEEDYKITGDSLRVREFRAILREQEGQKENMTISGITGKRKIVNSVFRMVQRAERPEAGIIGQNLWLKLHDEDHDEEILQILKEIEKWCQYRNEIIHCLLNKNIESLNTQIEKQAKAGFQLFRRLDQQTNWLKRKRIREKLGLKA